MIIKFPFIQKLIFASLLATAASLSACRQDRLDVDVSDIAVDVKIKRFDKELFSRKDALPQVSAEIGRRYPGFYDLFCRSIIRVGDPSDPSALSSLKGFTMDPEVNRVYRETQERYPSLDAEEKQLTEAFRHYRYHFPKKQIPQVVAYFSAFNYAIVTADNVLGIGLDMYLGKEYKIYPAMGIPLYKVRRMERAFIAADAMKGWASSEYPESPGVRDFLSQCIYNGKVLYFLDAMMPEAHDTLKTGYTGEQLEWCKENEANIWAFFIEKKLLFSTDAGEFMKFLTDGPTTNGLPKESPSMLGHWIGWQVVRQYMDRHPEISLEQLMNEKDARKILNESKYKPKK